MKRLVISALTLGFPLTLVPLFDTRRHWFFAECPLNVPSPREVYLGKRSTGARGQRASRPASGAHPTRGRPACCRHALVRARPVHQPARAAKAHCGGNPTATARHRQPPPSRPTSSWHPVAPTRSRARARRPRSQPCSPCLHQRASASSWHPASASTLLAPTQMPTGRRCRS